MKIHVLSDLHMEFGSFDYEPADADAVVLAGDTHTKLNGVKWALEAIPDKPVLYILGNHEYYGSKLPRLEEKLKDLAVGTNLHVLEDDIFELNGYHFFGATFWTDMDLFGNPEMGSLTAQLSMNDYKRIRHSPSWKKLTPSHTRLKHTRTMEALRKCLHKGDARRTVIISHHAPSIRSLPERRRTETVSCAYASNLDEFIEEREPLLWIHGHIHHSNDYEIGRTRVIANPRAYVPDTNPGFDPLLVIDLDQLG